MALVSIMLTLAIAEILGSASRIEDRKIKDLRFAVVLSWSDGTAATVGRWEGVMVSWL